uniref:uDENN domain-containing protein n=1 Tax=Oncorhynchus mykiss TaxID=8022 RepID=A0A8K9V8S7_ONCMY
MGSRIKDNPEAPFEVYLEMTHPGTAGSDPEVRRGFPEDYIDQETLQTVPKFCFPFSVDRYVCSKAHTYTYAHTPLLSFVMPHNRFLESLRSKAPPPHHTHRHHPLG